MPPNNYGFAGVYWAREFGASPSRMNSISAQIGHMETDNENLDHQLSKSGKKIYGHGKGYFQFEVGFKNGKPRGFQTAINRYINLITFPEDKNGLGKDKSAIPKWVMDAKNHGDPSLLSRGHQEELMFANLAMQRNSNDSIKTALQTNDASNLWVDLHYGGKEKEDRKEKWGIKMDLDSKKVTYKDTYQRSLMEDMIKGQEGLDPVSRRRPSYRSPVQQFDKHY